jgi:hypothetical protein
VAVVEAGARRHLRVLWTQSRARLCKPSQAFVHTALVHTILSCMLPTSYSAIISIHLAPLRGAAEYKAPSSRKSLNNTRVR